MTITMTQVVTVVGFVLFINCFNVSYAKSIKVGEYSNKYHNKTRRTDYQHLGVTKFDANSLRQFVPGLCLQATLVFADKKSVEQLKRPLISVKICSRTAANFAIWAVSVIITSEKRKWVYK